MPADHATLDAVTSDGPGIDPGDEPDDADTDETDDDDDDVIVLSWWQHPVNVITMLVATVLIGGMIGWLVGDAGNEVATSDADVGFLQDMRVHHEQAVEMSLTFLGLDDVDPNLVAEARGIAFGQGMDIGVMIQLLRDMDAPTESEEGQAMAWMGMAMNDEDMPGMATAEQLAELRSSNGADADTLFIDLMTAHHEGGVEMAETAAGLVENADVRTYAEAWARNQRTEIAEMAALRPEAG